MSCFDLGVSDKTGIADGDRLTLLIQALPPL